MSVLGDGRKRARPWRREVWGHSVSGIHLIIKTEELLIVLGEAGRDELLMLQIQALKFCSQCDAVRRRDGES